MKTWLLVLMTVVVTGGLVGGGTYYYFNKKADKDIAALQKQIDTLRTEAGAEVETVAVADATADWKTFNNTKYGYSFKYPKEVVLSTTEGGGIESAEEVDTKEQTKVATLTKSDDANFHWSVLTQEGIKTISKDSLKNHFALDFRLDKIQIGAESGYQVVNITGDKSIVSNFYFVQNSQSTVFQITMTKDSAIAQKVLDTFKFDETLTWKTYTSTKYGFSAKYPADWYLIDTPEFDAVSFAPDKACPVGTGGCGRRELSLSAKPVTSGKTLDTVAPDVIFGQGNTYNKASLTIGGQPAYKLNSNCDKNSGVGCGLSQWIMINGLNLYEFDAGTDNASIIAIYEKILSTFQFTK